MTARDVVRKQLLSAGVRNLQEFGYPQVTRENIMTDSVFKIFFKRMLEENRESRAASTIQKQVMNEMIKEIDG